MLALWAGVIVATQPPCLFVAKLCKGASEVARLGVDLRELLVAGETLVDPPVVTATGLTVTGAGVIAAEDGALTVVAALVSGGTAGTTYRVWFEVMTSLGQTRRRYLSLTVEADA